ncbi:MAG: response regulator transcription factor [Oscillospiraceae bacterium]|nr:response regulator transcription factor [Oscillospiraceae bacterium]MBQ2153489.1 response regulator transcription factor [Oscillospiraceae bacterium]
MRYLIVEDEQDLNEIICRHLQAEGSSVDACFDGAEAIQILSYTDYDAVVLDIMMPKADGYAVLRSLRDAGRQTPVLFLTARDSVADRVRGLDSGANDYLIKPFSLAELSARLRAMTRKAAGSADNVLRVADLTLDYAAKTVRRAGEEIPLSAREYAILEYLMLNRGTVLSREKIEDHVWNFDYEGGTNVVDVYISYLRKKIDEGRPVRLIHTVRGRGYVLREEETP